MEQAEYTKGSKITNSKPDDKDYLISSRVRTSRMFGSDKSLVLHGGGNTSVKIMEKNIFGKEEEVLYVKGSGWDLETITVDGFSPVRLQYLRSLSKLPALSDASMVNELVTHLTKSSAPVPSVEAILHAVIPYRYVDHTHADAVLAITNTPDGERLIREIYGNTVLIIPYIMPGFDLSKLCADQIDKHLTNEMEGIILLNHGIFSFGDTAEQSYNRMISLVKKAEDYLNDNIGTDLKPSYKKINKNLSSELTMLRKQISSIAGFPVILKRFTDEKSLDFCNRADVGILSQQGPVTPDHVLRTKRLPMLGRNLDEYVKSYINYFEENEPLAKERKKMLDPAPRVILDKELGLCTVGKTSKDAQIVADIYSHTIDVITRANKLGGYKALPAKDIFDVEYWELEQAKLLKSAKGPEFTGQIALVTGAASGIGKACVQSFLNRGAAVIGLDINKSVENLFTNNAFLGIHCDISSEAQFAEAIEKGVDSFGGIDMLILNAGIFPVAKGIEMLGTDDWRKVMGINLDANFMMMRECFPFLKLAVNGGRIVVIGSKNVPAPGMGASAYSASKAALTQLARVAALEWGRYGIRINVVHPNAVFDTALWSDEVLASRAKSYGVSVGEYRKNNVLQTEITSTDVSELVLTMCGNVFSKTTGAQVAIDGGNDRVI